MPMRLKGLFGGSALAAEHADNMGNAVNLTAPVEIVAAKDGDEAKLATFDTMAYTGASMKVSGWRYPVIIDLGGYQARRQVIPALRDHDHGRVVGHSSEVAVGADGVRVKGVVSGTGADSQEIVGNSKNGFPWQVSLGSNPVPGGVEHLPAGKTATVNGREIRGPHSIIRKAVAEEVSFTALGADSDTSATIAATKNEETIMTFDQWLTENNIEADSLQPAVKAALEATFNEEGGEQQEAPVNAAVDVSAIVAEAREAVREAVVEETKAIRAQQASEARIAAACEGHPEILAEAIKENWTPEKAELAVLRANTPRPIFASSNSEGAPDGAKVIEASLCLNAGMAEDDAAKSYGDNTVEAAASSRMRGFGLHSLMHETIRAAGRTVSPGTSGDALIRAAFEADQAIKASGVSNFSLSSTLSNIANKSIAMGFNSVERAWEQIAHVGSVSDFKQRTSHRLTGDFKYEQIGADGEIKHATAGEATYTNQAETYAKMFAVSRKDLRNDDLNAIWSTARTKIGRGAALKINDVFWTEFMDNASFFTAGNGNYDEGADTALGIDSITLAENLFFDQTDEDGDPINLEPEILLVPNGLKTTADTLMVDTGVRDTTSSTKYTTGNPHAGKYRVVRSAYLNKAAYTGYSNLAWYLLCDPSALGVGVIEIVFLDGRRVPFVEQTELDFNMLGMQMRGYHDFGVNKQELRCGVKMLGESE